MFKKHIKRDFQRKDGGDGGGGNANRTEQQIADELKRISEEVKRAGTEAMIEVKKAGDMSAETKATVDKLLNAQGGLAAELADLQQKMARRIETGTPAIKSLGQQFTEGRMPEIAALSRKSGRVALDVKNVSTISADSGGGANYTTGLIVPDRQPGVITPPLRPLRIRDLLAPGRTSSNAIQYVRETGFTNSAASVSEVLGALKPQSDLAFDIVTQPVSTIAHWLLATKQILDDAPMLETYIDNRLTYGLKFVEDAQLLMGAGTGTDLKGLYPSATAYVAPIVIANETTIDRIRLALLQVELALYPASGIVLHPSDWARMELTKTTYGEYIFGNAQQSAQPTLWGRPVVTSIAMPQNDFLTGAFKLAAQIFDREDAIVEVSSEDSDNFRRNLVTIRAEERLALAIYRPEAFIKGTLTP